MLEREAFFRKYRDCRKWNFGSRDTSSLYASKMIMRPERETKESRDPCPGQTDSRYDEGSLREPGLTPENAAPHRRAAAQTCCGDDYASQPVARPARAIQCG